MTRLIFLHPGRLPLMLLALLLWAGSAAAATYDWTAQQVSVAFAGGPAVPMWAYVDASGHHGFDGSGPVVIREVAGNDLIINLTNSLSEPTSLIIKGQPFNDGGAPVMIPDANGVPRVRSFVRETAASATDSYQWSNLRAGTYLITSGSHAAVQGPMGLYAVLVVEQSPVDPGVTPGLAYPANPAADYSYDQDLVLLFSSVDPVMNGHVADGSYGDADYPTALHVGYDARYFLVNGQPFTSERPLIPAVEVGQRVLVRLVNADIETRIPTAAGPTVTLLAEDGYPYSHPKGRQNSIDLPAGKSADALFVAPATSGYLPVFDRRLGLTNEGAGPGGMLAYLPVVDTAVPLRQLTVNPPSGTRVTVTSAPGGLDCSNPASASCSQSYFDGTSLRLHASATAGDLTLSGWTVTPAATPAECTAPRDCVVTLDADKSVAPVFVQVTQLAFSSPAAGEILQPGANYLVTWVAPAAMVRFDLGYSLGSGSPWVKLADKTSAFEYLWNVPTQVRGSSQLRLALIGYDDTGAVAATVQTDVLNLQDSISLIAPNGGELYHSGEVLPISWTSVLADRQVSRVGLWYQTAAGNPWVPIASLAGNTSTFDWTIPASLTAAAARIGVTLYGADGRPLVLDISDQPFAIEAPVAAPAALPDTIVVSPRVTPPQAVAIAGGEGLVLLSPNGGEFIPVDTSYTVLWQALAGSDHFSLEYSLDGGSTWQPVAENLVDSQYDWVIPAELRGNPAVLLRVSAFDREGTVLAVDLSDASFGLE